MLKLGVMVSGGGTNLQAIIDASESGALDAQVVAVVSNKKDAYALNRAAKHNIDGASIRKRDFETQRAYEQAMIDYFNERGVELVVLAGFLVVLSDFFVSAFKNRIINIHPSLIPSFCGKGYYGLKVHEAVLNSGVKVSGATVHFVDEDTDTGPIILQKAVCVNDDDTPESLQARISAECEWQILVEAIRLYECGRLTIVGNTVKVNK